MFWIHPTNNDTFEHHQISFNICSDFYPYYLINWCNGSSKYSGFLSWESLHIAFFGDYHNHVVSRTLALSRDSQVKSGVAIKQLDTCSPWYAEDHTHNSKLPVLIKSMLRNVRNVLFLYGNNSAHMQRGCIFILPQYGKRKSGAFFFPKYVYWLN